MAEMVVIRKAALNESHLRAGRTQHFIHGRAREKRVSALSLVVCHFNRWQ